MTRDPAGNVYAAIEFFTEVGLELEGPEGILIGRAEELGGQR